MTTSEPTAATPRRPIDEGDWNMAYLFPAEVAEARRRNGLVILPVAPVEWHGPHLAMGCGQPTPDRTLRADRDPRAHTDASWGLEQIERAARETIEEVTATRASARSRSSLPPGAGPRPLTSQPAVSR